MNSPVEKVRTTGDPATPRVAGPWLPLDAIDRTWAAVSYNRSVTSLDVPPADRVRAALLVLARLVPQIGRWATDGQLLWRPVAEHEWDQWLEQSFVASDEKGASPDRVRQLNERVPEVTPLRVMVGPDWLSVRMFHSVGDGWTVNSFIAELLTRAGREEPRPAPLPWTVLTARERDRVIRHDVRKHFGTVLWALRHRGDLAGGVYEAAGEDVALGRDSTFEVVSDPGLPEELRELRDQYFPGVSAAVMSTVALRSAVRDAVAAPRPGFECLFNTRDKKHGTANAWGNYSAGVYVRPEQDYDVASVGAEMQRVRRVGVPSLGHASLRLRGRRADGHVAMPRREGAPRLTMSYLQSHNMDPFVPGARLNETRIGSISRPNGADSVTLQVVECAGRLHIAVAHFPHVWPEAGLRTAVNAFLTDPAAVLIRLRHST